jgi:hypothetical protein
MLTVEHVDRLTSTCTARKSTVDSKVRMLRLVAMFCSIFVQLSFNLQNSFSSMCFLNITIELDSYILLLQEYPRASIKATPARSARKPKFQHSITAKKRKRREPGHLFKKKELTARDYSRQFPIQDRNHRPL